MINQSKSFFDKFIDKIPKSWTLKDLISGIDGFEIYDYFADEDMFVKDMFHLNLKHFERFNNCPKIKENFLTDEIEKISARVYDNMF